MKIKKLVSLSLAVVTAASVALTGCGSRIDADKIVATLDDKEISLGLANFMAQYKAITYDSFYLSYAGEDMWSQDLSGSGSTMQDNVKDSVLEEIETDYLLDAHMADYGVEITQDEIDKMEAAAEEFLADNTDEAIKVMGATKEYVTEMLRLNLVQSKMHDAIIADVDTEESDEEAAQRTFSYIQISTAGHTDDSGNYVAYTEDEVAALADTAEQVASAAKTDFDAAATDNGYTVSTYSYGADEIGEDGTATGSMDASVITAADALSEGEVSSLITVDGTGYYVLRLDSEFDEEATETKKSDIVSGRQSDKYTSVCDAYKEAAEWTVNDKVWAAVNFDKLYSIKEEATETEGTGETTETEREAVNTEALNTEADNTEALGGTESVNSTEK